MSTSLRFPASQRRQPSSTELAAQGQRLFLGSLLFLLFGIFTSLGGWEWLLSTPPTLDDRAQSISRSAEMPSFIQWPFSLFYFVILVVPLTLYIVIARWTGEQYFKYS